MNKKWQILSAEETKQFYEAIEKEKELKRKKWTIEELSQQFRQAFQDEKLKKKPLKNEKKEGIGLTCKKKNQ